MLCAAAQCHVAELRGAAPCHLRHRTYLSLCLINSCVGAISFSGVHLFRLLVYWVSGYCVFQFYSHVHTGCLHFSLMLSFSSSYSLIHRRRSLLFCVGALSDCYIYLLIAMMVSQKTTKKCSCLMLLHRISKL
jgi:hypothetical protein